MGLLDHLENQEKWESLALQVFLECLDPKEIWVLLGPKVVQVFKVPEVILVNLVTLENLVKWDHQVKMA